MGKDMVPSPSNVHAPGLKCGADDGSSASESIGKEQERVNRRGDGIWAVAFVRKG